MSIDHVTEPGPRPDTVDLLRDLRTSATAGGLALFDRFADRVHDLVFFLTRDPATAAAITRDVIVMTATQRRSFDDAEDVRAWMYAQARTEAFALLHSRGRRPAEDRVVEVDDLPDAHTPADLAGLVWTATAAFTERDQALVTLHLRHGLEGAELADALGVSSGAVEVLLPGTLERVSTQIRALLVLVTDCGADHPELDALRARWDGTFSPLVRRRATELETTCAELWDDDRTAPLQLLQSIPLVPAPAGLRAAVADRLALAEALGDVPAAATGLDETVPPTTHATVPPPTVPASAPGPDQPEGGAATPAAPPPATPGPTSTPTAGLAAAEGAETTVVEDERPGWRRPASRAGRVSGSRPGIPRHLAIALGVAFGLVVAASIFRLVLAADPPTEAVVTGPQTAAMASDLDAPAIPAATAGADDGPEGSTSSAAAPATTTSAVPSSPPPPGSLTGPAGPVEVPAGAVAALRVANSGGTAVEYQVITSPGWLMIEPVQGSLDPGAAAELEIAQADGLAEGDYTGRVVIQWDGSPGGRMVVDVTTAVNEPPVLENVQIATTALQVQGCPVTQTEIAVEVADPSPLDEVVVVATGPAPDAQAQTALAADPDQPGRYVGVLGPFTAPGEVGLTISAVDRRGNESEAAAPGLVVQGC